MREQGTGPGSGASAPPPAFPCLNSNNSDNALSAGHRRTAFALGFNVRELVVESGIERIGFLTLTFADHVVSIKEGSRRFNNAARRLLKRYTKWIAVPERQQSKR